MSLTKQRPWGWFNPLLHIFTLVSWSPCLGLLCVSHCSISLKNVQLCKQGLFKRPHAIALACFKWLSKEMTPECYVCLSVWHHPHIIHQRFDKTCTVCCLHWLSTTTLGTHTPFFTTTSTQDVHRTWHHNEPAVQASNSHNAVLYSVVGRTRVHQV